MISIWALPVLLSFTLHEAGHAYAAWKLGDDTALNAGRLSFNPLKHISLNGTIIFPVILVMLGSPVIFAAAKPVPVNFAKLRNPRRDIILVALAGPLMNFLLIIAVVILGSLHGFFPEAIKGWVLANLGNMVLLNIMLVIFNLLPIPPLDGGRVAVGLLPAKPARMLARIEPYGIMILIGVLIGLPYIGQMIGVDLNLFKHFITPIMVGFLHMVEWLSLLIS